MTPVPVTTELEVAASQWASHDPDPVTAAQLRALIAAAPTDSEAAAELADSFAGNLQFGTAGLRAVMGPGPNRMNRAVVRRAAAGLAAHVLDLASDAGASAQPERATGYRPRAVVGFDARHNSAIFARESAAILAAAGIETFLLPSALPTPVLAYAVRALNCEAGVMVTASHNPPKDNGYKVYLGGRAVEAAARGVQIVAPHDSGIAAHIARVSATVEAGDTSTIALAADGWTVLGDDLVAGYRAAVGGLADPQAFPARDLRIVHTSMHGVGNDTALQLLRDAGFDDVHAVAEQSAPDPEFPTVSFPNPEEPGAMDLAFALARTVGADVILANDPDADRAAVGVLDPATGDWHKLHGDQVGALLGAHLAARGGSSTHSADAPVFANSIVSSRLLSRISAAAGFAHSQTLTGFKWISRVPGLTFGYEEALGYCVAPEVVRDKDGMSAGLLVAEMAANLKAQGRTLLDVLDDLALEHGLHASDQISIRVEDLSDITAMMARLRAQPPVSFDGSAVAESTDLSVGTPELPATDGLLYLTENDTRVIVRPSGTEPKLKCYLEVIVPVAGREQLSAARDEAARALAAVSADIKAALGK
ncbi:phosphomannomutase [Arthrobacter sp. ERGS1:01]|uniref:phospho-sugar mutase n=1 Tax=Arthrobacter sp. ERGS1:01 TaxID=1704044 RepID=UPI0006B47A55|nr:phospho-sugar mutase [Arthrobacter sp. ERGS1:01]ALE05182.1 phosphomannomutase [Arthrobacter sp. ERGS1:01]